MPSSWFEPLPARATYQAEEHGENRVALPEAAAAAGAPPSPPPSANAEAGGLLGGRPARRLHARVRLRAAAALVAPAAGRRVEAPLVGSHPAGAPGPPRAPAV